MKRRFRILMVALVMSLTMMFGMSTTAFAAEYDITDDVDTGEVPLVDSGEEKFSIKNSTDVDVPYTIEVYFGDVSLSIPEAGTTEAHGGTTSWYNKWDSDNINAQLQYVGISDKTAADVEHKTRVTWNKTSKTLTVYYYFKSSGPTPPGNDPEKPSAPAHVHSFIWQTITEPTKDSDGLEGEVCSCGATRNTQPLSAFGFILNDYAPSLIKAAKPGQTVTFEFGEWNSFPKEFMAKLVDKSAQNVTFVFHYNWNHVKQEITIPAGTPIDLNFDWYGPAKMAELYGNN